MAIQAALRQPNRMLAAGLSATLGLPSGTTVIGGSRELSVDAREKENSGTYEPGGRLIRNLEFGPALP